MMMRCRSVWAALLLVSCTVLAAPPPADEEADIAAWNAFADELKKTGADFLRQYRQPDEVGRAEGPLYLAQQLAYVVSAVMAERDRAFPLLRLSATNIHKWGLDGADAKYTGAALDSSGVYRLSGRLGSAKLIAIQAVQSTPRFAAFASLSGADLVKDAQGGFEVMIARERPPGWTGPWLRLDAATTHLLVREYFNDWDAEQPSEMTLARVDEASARPTPVLPDTAATLAQMTAQFDIRTRQWMPWLAKTRSAPPNRLQVLPQTGQGLKNNVYGEGWYDIGPDQALIIELSDPDADLWSFQLGNLWWESIDYINGTGSINGHQAVPDGDGRYRLVIALQDPGVPNWLNPAGHRQGFIMYRFQNSASAAVPTTRLVSLAQLAAALPADAVRITPAQRRAQIEARRAHALKRWAP